MQKYFSFFLFLFSIKTFSMHIQNYSIEDFNLENIDHIFNQESLESKDYVIKINNLNSQDDLEKLYAVLYESGIDMFLANKIFGKNNSSLLSLACQFRNFKMTAELLEIGANVNSKDKNGETPLMHAVRNNDFEITVLLCDYKADIRIVNKLKHGPIKINNDVLNLQRQHNQEEFNTALVIKEFLLSELTKFFNK